jgi:hypothetical protein
MARAKQRLASLTAIEGRAAEMLAVVSTAATHLGQKLAGVREQEDLIRNPSDDLLVVAPANRPPWPATSYRKAIAAGIPVATVLVTFLSWLVWAFWGLRVHTAKELAYWGRGPVVATSTWPREPGGLSSLAAELHVPLSRVALGAYIRDSSLFAPEYPILLVPASAIETPLAAELGARLAGSAISEGDSAPASVAAPLEVWRGPLHGAEIRLAVQKSERVLVLLASGRHSLLSVSVIHARLGRSERVAFLLCDVGEIIAGLDSQVGDVPGFWEGSPAEHASQAWGATIRS